MKEFNYKINGTSYKVYVRKSDANQVELEVNGTPFIVELETKEKKKAAAPKRESIGHEVPTPQTAKPSLVVKPAAPASRSTINAPLPGNILSLNCKVGDEVKKGDTLLVLEAMKMENNIVAIDNGKVVEILVNKGDTVADGAALVVIE
ncbi:MAG: biotin/lipoyl-binding protein [Dysgonamonadaceae bacterium]|jgi:biotin carboxyl carrier protein|nr:biotin/lipoyl-binding protein [Dysgonamonadaceae bacterium]